MYVRVHCLFMRSRTFFYILQAFTAINLSLELSTLSIGLHINTSKQLVYHFSYIHVNNCESLLTPLCIKAMYLTSALAISIDGIYYLVK